MRLYILIRTSGRPQGFKKLMESVRALEWEDKFIITHTDDPRDTYVEGDIVIKGEGFPSYIGTAPYNLYNNRLLEAIPADGWVHMIDDDDYYGSPDCLNWLHGQDPQYMHICKAERMGGRVFPKQWKKQKSYQTECFVLHSSIAKKYRWWADKGGDHNYSRRITREHPLKWHDVIVARIQSLEFGSNGKGFGKRIDIDNQKRFYSEPEPHEQVWVVYEKRTGVKRTEYICYAEAKILEKHGMCRITYKGEKLWKNIWLQPTYSKDQKCQLVG